MSYPITKEDQLGLSTLNRQELEDSLRAWIKSNSPGGWIDNLRCDVARYESSRAVLTLLIDTQRDKIRELEAERDQYKQKADEYAQLAIRYANQIRRSGT